MELVLEFFIVNNYLIDGLVFKKWDIFHIDIKHLNVDIVHINYIKKYRILIHNLSQHFSLPKAGSSSDEANREKLMGTVGFASK